MGRCHTFRIVPCVKFEEFSRVVREGIYIDSVLQNNDYPGGRQTQAKNYVDIGNGGKSESTVQPPFGERDEGMGHTV